jgi:hypothetical protein
MTAASPLPDQEYGFVLQAVRYRARALQQARRRLDGVTCFCATSVRVPRAVAMLRLCAELCEFDEVVLATHETLPARQTAFLRLVPVPPITGKGAYSRLILDALKHIIRTEYVLVVQEDGFVLNPGAWDDAFYDCDYIGAPWPEKLMLDPPGTVIQPKNRVGNGGFSFRSQRLLHACALSSAPFHGHDTLPEDLLIGHFAYEYLRATGIRFADVSLASRFSGETPSPEGVLRLDQVFGFHGALVLEALARQIRPH